MKLLATIILAALLSACNNQPAPPAAPSDLEVVGETLDLGTVHVRVIRRKSTGQEFILAQGTYSGAPVSISPVSSK
jgi:hypothetical protein